MIKDWIDILRSGDFFNLIASNRDYTVVLTQALVGGAGGINTGYDELHPIFNVPEDFPYENPPDFIAMSDAQSHVTSDNIPHMADPAPAQKAGNVAFIWGKPKGLSGGEAYAEWVDAIPDSTSFLDSIYLHRDDDFPAIIEAVSLHKHYYHGKLHRKGQHPAIKAEYVFASWYQNNDNYRSNGPSVIKMENYKEFWQDGEFQGYRCPSITPFWKHRVLDSPEDEDTLGMFLEDLKGKTDPFGNTYFTDPEDEVIYMADFS